MKGYAVKQAFCYQQAKEMFDHEFELVLIDIQLPGGNGISLCQYIRLHSCVPIIFLTAKNDEETIVEALNSGGDDYITKPFRANELIERMKSIERRIQKSDMILTGDLEIDMLGYMFIKRKKKFS